MSAGKCHLHCLTAVLWERVCSESSAANLAVVNHVMTSFIEVSRDHSVSSSYIYIYIYIFFFLNGFFWVKVFNTDSSMLSMSHCILLNLVGNGFFML